MFDWLWQALIYSVPWWVWLWIGLIVLVVLALVIRSYGGLRNVLVIVGVAGVALAAAILHTRGRQSGWNDRQSKEQKDANTTLDRAHRARADAVIRGDDPDGLRDDDGFRIDD